MKVETILSGLEKLYAKRKALDTQISEAEKKLVGEVKNAAKTVVAVKGKAAAIKGKIAAVKKSVGRPAKKAKPLADK
jgi:pantothenate kinase